MPAATSWVTGSTVSELRTDVCSACHPFYTGQQQRIVDRPVRLSALTGVSRPLACASEEAVIRDAARAKRAEERRLVEIVDEEDVEPIEGLEEEA